jgi:hypothetical protein
MKTLQVGIIDLICKGPTETLWAKVMHANLASIMPQVVGTWCEQQGHRVTFVTYTGSEDLSKELNGELDILFINSFTQAALLSYAISNYYRSQGVITVLGGPHARCYPDDARQYFDYVLGFTDRNLIVDVLSNCLPHKPGIHLSAGRHPMEICSVEERWKYIEPTLKKAPFLKITPMLSSLGCPYTCPFCIDSEVPYKALNVDIIRADLKFLQTKFKKPWVVWHDPNFGIRFDEIMDTIGAVVPSDRFSFIAESSLSVLTEKHLKVLKKNGFIGLLPGVESWYDLGNKSATSRIKGIDKVKQVSDHVNMIFKYIPYVQTNFVLGLDSDAGPEPFELTKQFIRQTPSVFPGYSLLTAFGEAAPLNLEYQRLNRILPFPFHFLNNHEAMNIKPKNYEWVDFYDKVIDLTAFSFSKQSIVRRFLAGHGIVPKWMNVMRAISNEGYGRLRFFRKVRNLLIHDKAFRDFFEGESRLLPSFYVDIVRKDLGIWWKWLPLNAVMHEQNAYLQKSLSLSSQITA